MEYTAGRGTTALGIIGTVLGGTALVNNGNGGGLLGNILGTNCNNGPMMVDSNSMPVNRYELGKDQTIAELKSQIALRDANIYGDQKLLEVYKYFDGELKDVRAELCHQKVHNQRTEDSFALAQSDLRAVKNELECQIRNEAEKRCCGDNAIVNYVNATFYPKMVADVTTGTTTTAQMTYDPLPNCGCGCRK